MCWYSQILLIPAVCKETAVSMARAIAAWCRAGGALALEGLPGERSAVKKTFLLPACCQWTAIGTAVGGILPTDVAQTITARNWTPGTGRKQWFDSCHEQTHWSKSGLLGDSKKLRWKRKHGGIYFATRNDKCHIECLWWVKWTIS